MSHNLAFDVEYQITQSRRVKNLEAENSKLRALLGRAQQALMLIAAPKRPDGTYNRCREACEVIARRAIEEIKGVDHV